MKKALAVVVALALVATMVVAVPKESRAGGRAAEGALIATGVILFGQALGIVPTPRPFYQRPYVREQVVIIHEPAPVYYYPAPRVYEPPPYERYWVPGHWEGNIWVEGHWENRPLDSGRTGYYQPPTGYYRSGYSSYGSGYGWR